jgi:hypothetical protein
MGFDHSEGNTPRQANTAQALGRQGRFDHPVLCNDGWMRAFKYHRLPKTSLFRAYGYYKVTRRGRHVLLVLGACEGSIFPLRINPESD